MSATRQNTTRARRLEVLIALIVAAALATGCSWFDRRAKLLPIALPDLARVDPAVQAQARERYEALTRKIADRGTPQTELASVYGQYGMLLQAAGYFDAAEPCYVNAQTLARDEIRWPYYLAHLYKSRGETDRSEAAFRQVIALRPGRFPCACLARPAPARQGPTRGGGAALREGPRADAAIGGGAGRTRPGRSRQTRLRERRAAFRGRAHDRPGIREPALAARDGVPWTRSARQGSAPPAPVEEHGHPASGSAAAGAGPAARERPLVRAARSARSRRQGLQRRCRLFPKGRGPDSRHHSAPPLAPAQAGHRVVHDRTARRSRRAVRGGRPGGAGRRDRRVGRQGALQSRRPRGVKGAVGDGPRTLCSRSALSTELRRGSTGTGRRTATEQPGTGVAA